MSRSLPLHHEKRLIDRQPWRCAPLVAAFSVLCLLSVTGCTATVKSIQGPVKNPINPVAPVNASPAGEEPRAELRSIAATVFVGQEEAEYEPGCEGCGNRGDLVFRRDGTVEILWAGADVGEEGSYVQEGGTVVIITQRDSLDDNGDDIVIRERFTFAVSEDGNAISHKLRGTYIFSRFTDQESKALTPSPIGGLPTPSAAIDFSDPDFQPYLAQLSQAGLESRIEEPSKRSDSQDHVIRSKALVVHTSAPLAGCWSALQALLKIPGELTLPEEGPAEQVIKNSNKAEGLWEESVTVSRDAAGRIHTVHYYRRSEGGGSGAWVKVDDHVLRISLDTIVD